MKIKCIDNFQTHNELTLGKLYDVLHTYSTCYAIINDKGVQDKYMKDRFEVIPTIDDVIKGNIISNPLKDTSDFLGHINNEIADRSKYTSKAFNTVNETFEIITQRTTKVV